MKQRAATRTRGFVKRVGVLYKTGLRRGLSEIVQILIAFCFRALVFRMALMFASAAFLKWWIKMPEVAAVSTIARSMPVNWTVLPIYVMRPEITANSLSLNGTSGLWPGTWFLVNCVAPLAGPDATNWRQGRRCTMRERVS